MERRTVFEMLLLLILSVIAVSLAQAPTTTTTPTPTTPQLEILGNVSYGSDPQQTMDIYLPPGRNLSTKVIILIHGGGWSGGTKEGMNGWVAFFYFAFQARFAIVNIRYRLGTIQSPALPKQIEDIALAIQFLKSKQIEYLINPNFIGLFGVSAGAHLSMLYGYGFDTAKDVGVIGNLVGPAALLDPAYTGNRTFDPLFFPLVGNNTFAQNPYVYYFSSPDSYITANAPKTISFYGDADPLIPSTQGEILEDKLDKVRVYNKFYIYPGGSHAVFTPAQNKHMYKKLTYFYNNYL